MSGADVSAKPLAYWHLRRPSS